VREKRSKDSGLNFCNDFRDHASEESGCPEENAENEGGLFEETSR
jgi:hypothetical protein